MKVVFMGSGLFALEVLKGILSESSNIELKAILTQPDKPFGRKKVLTPTLVGSFTENLQIPLFKAEKSAEIIRVFESETYFNDIDYILVADYGVLLSEQVLKLPKKLCLNVHGSLLPKYRGASPVHAAILNHEKETGVCIITMEKGLDSGPVWGESKLDLVGDETYENLLPVLGKLGGELLVSILPKIYNDEINPLVQEESKVSHVGKIKKEDGFVDINIVSAVDFWAKYRAYNVWPQIFINYKGVKFVLTKVSKFTETIDASVGIDTFGTSELFLYDKMLLLKLEEVIFVVEKFKPESKSEMDPYSFSLGNPDFFQELK